MAQKQPVANTQGSGVLASKSRAPESASVAEDAAEELESSSSDSASSLRSSGCRSARRLLGMVSCGGAVAQSSGMVYLLKQTQHAR